jgi:deoxyribonuclease IV
MLLGAHVGVAKGLAQAAQEGRRIGCDAIQIFSKSPQMWAGPPIAPEAAASFRAAVAAENLRATAVHHGYLLNLANPKRTMLKRTRKMFVDEIQRAELLGVDALIFHPGAHLASGAEAGCRQIAEGLTFALGEVPEGKVRILLENAAGAGTAIGSKFEELGQILTLANRPDRLGVALDTCHLFAAGNDFRTEEGYGRMTDEVERAIGRANVWAFHLNDSKGPLGSHLDRHENIGKGAIGTEGFRHVVADPRWSEVPGYLETPLDDRDYERYVEDLKTLRSLLGTTAAGPLPSEGPARSKRRAPTPP